MDKFNQLLTVGEKFVKIVEEALITINLIAEKKIKKSHHNYHVLNYHDKPVIIMQTFPHENNIISKWNIKFYTTIDITTITNYRNILNEYFNIMVAPNVYQKIMIRSLLRQVSNVNHKVYITYNLSLIYYNTSFLTLIIDDLIRTIKLVEKIIYFAVVNYLMLYNNFKLL